MNEIQEEKESQEFRTLSKNTFYSFFINYGNVIFQIIISILIARTISKDAWGILILVNSYIMIIITISNYFPPAFDYSLNFYLPKHIIQNEKTTLKSVIKKAIVAKIILLIPIYSFSIFIFSIFSNFFKYTLKGNLEILFLLSPLIIIIALNTIYYSILRSFNMFKTIFLLQLIQYCINIILLFSYYIFLKIITIQVIVLINLLSYFIPFVMINIVIFLKIQNLESNTTHKIKYKSLIKEAAKYGAPISFGFLIYGFWKEIQIQGIAFFNEITNVTGYSMALNFAGYSELLIMSFFFPLLITFTRLNISKKLEEIEKIYNLILKVLLSIIPIITGVLLLFADFLLYLLYGSTYLTFSIFIKLMIISTIFRVILVPFEALLLAKNKVNLIPPLKLIRFFVYVTLFFIGLIYFGIIGAIISIIITDILIFLLYSFLSFRTLNIHLNLKIITFQYFIFIISLSITLLLEHFWLKELNQLLFKNLNLIIFDYFPLLSLLVLITMFFIQIKALKIFTVEDFEFIKVLIHKDKKQKKIIQKIIKFFKFLIVYKE